MVLATVGVGMVLETVSMVMVLATVMLSVPESEGPFYSSFRQQGFAQTLRSETRAICWFYAARLGTICDFPRMAQEHLFESNAWLVASLWLLVDSMHHG